MKSDGSPNPSPSLSRYHRGVDVASLFSPLQLLSMSSHRSGAPGKISGSPSLQSSPKSEKPRAGQRSMAVSFSSPCPSPSESV